MALRIGIDFDDTITDLSTLLTRLARERWDLDVPALRATGASFVDAPEFEPLRQLFGEILGSELTLETTPRPGAVEVMRRLGREHELIVVTARSDAETAFAGRWLAHHDIPVHDLVGTNRGPKAPVARERDLSVLLDDMAHNFSDFDGLTTLPALYLDGWDRGQAPPAHVHPVEHWHAFERLVHDVAHGRAPALDEAAGA